MFKDQKNIKLVETLLKINTMRMESFTTIIKELASLQGNWNIL